MGQLARKFPELRFRKEDLVFSDAEYRAVADDFWPGRSPAGQLSSKDRAFIQAALFVAVSKSEQAGFFFDLYKSFVTTTPSRSVTKLVLKLAHSTVRYRYRAYIDDTPEYSAVGKAALQYSPFGMEWKTRCALNDVSFLDDFRASAYD